MEAGISVGAGVSPALLCRRGRPQPPGMPRSHQGTPEPTQKGQLPLDLGRGCAQAVRGRIQGEQGIQLKVEG